jgi:hypothetical protein
MDQRGRRRIAGVPGVLGIPVDELPGQPGVTEAFQVHGQKGGVIQADTR